MNKLSFATEYGWMDKSDNPTLGPGFEDDEVLFLHAEISIRACDCYRCNRYKIRKKRDVLISAVGRDLTREEFLDIEREVHRENEAIHHGEG